MLAPEKAEAHAKPYLAATPRFATGADTPRDFLERCLADLAALEPKIGAFVHLNLDGARAAADQATARWRDGKPLSPIDGMPIGIKDIIETIDMPTEQRLAAVRGLPLRARRRQRRGAARGRRGHRRQDRDHRIRRHRAARHPQPARSAPHARRLEQRLGRRRSRPACSAPRSARR